MEFLSNNFSLIGIFAPENYCLKIIYTQELLSNSNLCPIVLQGTLFVDFFPTDLRLQIYIFPVNSNSMYFTKVLQRKMSYMTFHSRYIYIYSRFNQNATLLRVRYFSEQCLLNKNLRTTPHLGGS